MAIAACFAGPLFNLLMGLSVGLLISTAVHGPIRQGRTLVSISAQLELFCPPYTQPNS